jgi:hypothetical protein
VVVSKADALAPLRSADLTAVRFRLTERPADREGDIYEDFACKPSGVEVLIRAGQDRALTDGSRLFERAASLPEAARRTIELPAAPGRPARTVVLAVRFCTVEIARPVSRKGHPELQALPPSVTLTLVEALEVDPPEGMSIAHWRLLTIHKIADAADARRIVSFYRQRWPLGRGCFRRAGRSRSAATGSCR